MDNTTHLMFRDGGNNGNVLLGVSGIQQSPETTSPRADVASQLTDGQSGEERGETNTEGQAEERAEQLGTQVTTNPVDTDVQLQQTESAHSQHVLSRLDGLCIWRSVIKDS